jgi:dethiobiotin synthetase
MPEVAPSGYFITGSDTGVGKTWAGCQIVSQLSSQVQSLKVRKPIESGCELSANGLLYPADGDSLFKANNARESLDMVTPYRFRAALAPDRAALLENQIITLDDLIQAVHNNVESSDTLVVEGAGGFYSPIAQHALNSDLAKALGLKVIIVIADRLGAINQALLTINAVKACGLKICAVILNQTTQEHPEHMDNFCDLSSRIEIPLYQCLHQRQLPVMDLA